LYSFCHLFVDVPRGGGVNHTSCKGLGVRAVSLFPSLSYNGWRPGTIIKIPYKIPPFIIKRTSRGVSSSAETFHFETICELTVRHSR
ncbi:unnamed protein product, partial [Allacma fusca]